MLWQELIIRLIVVSRSEPRVGKIIKINETLLFHRISPNCSWKHLSNFAGVTAILDNSMDPREELVSAH